MSPERADRLQAIAWIGLGLAILWLLWLLSPILAPFLLAAILAYICDPLVNRLEGWRIPRPAGVLIVMLLLATAIALLALTLVPLVQREAQQLAARLLASLKIGGMALFGLLANLLLAPVVMFYLLRDWKDILARLEAMIPRRWHGRSTQMLREVDAVLAEFLRGQIAVMLLLAAYYSLGLWIAGVDFSLPLGLVTGLLVFIPYLGYAIGFLLALLVAALQLEGWGVVVGMLVVFGIGQMLEGFLLTPFLVGERIGLHPLAVIFALMAFGQLFGFFGVLLALPASAALLVGLREVRAAYLKSTFYQGG